MRYVPTACSLRRRDKMIIRKMQSLLQSNAVLSQRNEELASANARFEALATTDALTGVLNHRATHTALAAEVARAQRNNRPFSVVFFDIDHFKAVNDGYGHAAGDAVLKDLVAIAQCTLQTRDIIGRWGGEEFLAILPDTELPGAVQAAERLRATVASYIFVIGGGIHLTCSLGVASYPQDAIEHNHLVAAADQAMYAAKKLGRNQVRRFDDPVMATLDTSSHEMYSRNETMLMGTIDALVLIAEARDHSAREINQQVSHLCLQMALALGMPAPATRMIETAGRLRDIGIIGFPDIDLCSRNMADLTEEEKQYVLQHPQLSADIVSHIPMLRGIVPMVRGHHENWDGTGYPDGLAGECIPLGARIIAVADAFVSLLNSKNTPPLSVEAAINLLENKIGTQFDRDVIAVLKLVLLTQNDESAA
jgi:two-component system, cell cycle response regulator